LPSLLQIIDSTNAAAAKDVDIAASAHVSNKASSFQAADAETEADKVEAKRLLLNLFPYNDAVPLDSLLNA
jgi:hypothetical protein